MINKDSIKKLSSALVSICFTRRPFFFQQHICKVVYLEVVQEGSLNMLLPNNLLQQPMSGKLVLRLGTELRFLRDGLNISMLF